MAGIAVATLTGAGFSAGTTPPGAYALYSKTINSTIVVTVTLFTEVEGSGYAGVVQVVPNGDVTAADAATAAALLASIGFAQFATWPNSNVNLLAPLGLVSYSQGF